ncbi:MAG: transaldolase [Armatimonadota bacterium]
MSSSPLCKLEQFEQSIWLDFLSRDLIQSGQLQKLIEEDGLKGVTSNPTIFQKALAAGTEYDEEIRRMALEGKSPEEIFTVLSVEDVQTAADTLRPTWERLHHRDGFVSLEVNPHLAYETEATIAEARRLWSLVERPNAFIKVPATAPGLEAIRQLISEGININVTLLFGLPRYVEVTEAYLEGLEERVRQGQPVDDVHSVASFFLSRIDVLVDPELEKLAEQGGEKAELAKRFIGQAAIASAREAYRLAGHIFGHERFLKLKERGARIQRLLWASTSTKNPKYEDTKYVEALIAPETVNTLPLETIDAYRDHGHPAVRIKDDLDLTEEVLSRLTELGIDLAQVTKQLEQEGVQKFSDSYDKLMESLAQKRDEALQTSATP